MASTKDYTKAFMQVLTSSGDQKNNNAPDALYGTVQTVDKDKKEMTVKLDASGENVICSYTVSAKADDRVKVDITNHTATVTDNYSDAAPTTSELEETNKATTDSLTKYIDELSELQADPKRYPENWDEMTADEKTAWYKKNMPVKYAVDQTAAAIKKALDDSLYPVDDNGDAVSIWDRDGYQTYILGGLVYTKLLTAEQVAAIKIVADQVNTNNVQWLNNDDSADPTLKRGIRMFANNVAMGIYNVDDEGKATVGTKGGRFGVDVEEGAGIMGPGGNYMRIGKDTDGTGTGIFMNGHPALAAEYDETNKKLKLYLQEQT